MSDKTNSNTGFEKQLWDAACVLWGHIPAAEYRKVIIGLIFLRYISAAFDKRYDELVKEGDGFEDDRDAYSMENVFFVPQEARWNTIASAAHTPEIGVVIDNAMRAIESENSALKNVLPKNYASPDLDKRVLGEVVDIFTNNIDMSNTEESEDLLGRTYEYCIAQFAAYEGVKGGEFYTPSSVVKTLVEVLQPLENCRVYDPCCGSGGMFVQSYKFLRAHNGRRGAISVYGQESNPDTWKMAKMNLAIRGIDADFGPYQADTFTNDLHPTLKADYILANPPFNLSNWGQDSLIDDVRWKYGIPPASNANFAWIQHMIHHLSPNGKMGLVLANTALSIGTGEEYEIRKKIVEDNLVEAIVSLPAQLFYSTKIKVSIWFINKKKRNTDILFIDTRNLGHMISRTMKEFSDEDIAKIADCIHQFQAGENNLNNVGFSKVASLEEIREKKHNISPSKYILGSIEADEIGEYLNEIDEDIEELSSMQRVVNGAQIYSKYTKQLRVGSIETLIDEVSCLSAMGAHDFLCEADKVEENRKAALIKVRDISDKLFKHWFIDFNFPNEKGLLYKLNDGKLKESEYGIIPFDWNTCTMGSLLVASSEKVGERENIPEYSTTNQGVFPRASKFNKSLTQNANKNKVIVKGDIIFGMSREIFNFGVMVDEIGSVSPAYHVYHIDSSVMNPEFLEVYMRICSDYFLSLIKPGAREGQVLDKEELSRKVILCPPKELQEKYMLIRKHMTEWFM
ncbi:MAG: N-6 DNA methylase [Lachnospiraceae bacterium]|nr:N-6 DNA methylase [Lachnospiraceae bacterium]